MKASIIAMAAALISVASAWNYTTPSVTYTTETVTAYTTYCPAATEIVHGEQTYTVTEATTLTITNCPCTVSYPVTVSTVTSCSTCGPSIAPIYTNATTPAIASPTYAPSSSPVATEAPISTFTGAASRAVAGAGAGLAGLLGLAVLVL